jgi:hypothetical protein
VASRCHWSSMADSETCPIGLRIFLIAPNPAARREPRERRAWTTELRRR